MSNAHKIHHSAADAGVDVGSGSIKVAKGYGSFYANPVHIVGSTNKTGSSKKAIANNGNMGRQRKPRLYAVLGKLSKKLYKRSLAGYKCSDSNQLSNEYLYGSNSYKQRYGVGLLERTMYMAKIYKLHSKSLDRKDRQSNIPTVDKREYANMYDEPNRQSDVLQNKSVRNVAITERQKQVITALWDGLTMKQVADTIGICDKTAQYHRLKAIKNLGTDNILSACRIAIKLDILKT